MPGQSATPAVGRSAAALHVLTARLEDVPPGADGGPLPGLAEFLAAVPDHRRAQGRRHSLVSVLTLACAAVAAGARSLVAIAEWAADAPGHVLDSLGVRRDPCGGALVVPSETTIRRALCDTDPDALDEQLAAWAAPAAPQDDEVPAAQVMVDGKSLRGAIQADGRPVHLSPGPWGNLMRSLKTLIAATGVLALSIGVPATLTASAASAATTPVVYARGTGGWSHPSVRPKWILVGMGGAPGAHSWYWSAWDKGEPTPHATSTGTLWVNSCIPNCAQGKESYHHLIVTLSAVRTHNGVRYYSQMTWYTPGYRLYGYRTSTAVMHYSMTRGTVPYWR